MYNTFFGFRERPFKLVPNPHYLYLSRSHEKALARLEYAGARAEGFVMITGERGTGKTFLCRAFLENAEEDATIAYIHNSRLDAKGFLRSVNREFGIRSDFSAAGKLLHELSVFLVKKKAEGRGAVLIIDDAQYLGMDVFGLLRLLSKLRTNRQKLLRIVLVGEPAELYRRLESRELRQLAKRISLSYNISPLDFRETRQYITHRLHMASWNPRVHFTRQALWRIYRYSGGIPRFINIACDRVLLAAFSAGLRRITGRIARFAIAELSVGRRIPAVRKKALSVAVPVSAALLVAFAVILAYRFDIINPDTSRGMIQKRAETEQDGSFKTKQTVELRLEKPGKDPETLIRKFAPKSMSAAVSHVLSLWRNEVRMPDIINKDRESFIKEAAQNHGLEVYEVKGDFSLLRKLDLPAVLCLEDPETRQRVYLAALNFEQEKITFYNQHAEETVRVSAEAAGALWTGEAYVVWENPRQIEGVIGRDADADSVAGLQILLKAAGKNDVTVNGTYDRKTRFAIKQVQAGQGIPVNGYGDAATKIVLYRLAGSLNMPGSGSD